MALREGKILWIWRDSCVTSHTVHTHTHTGKDRRIDILVENAL